MPISYGTFEGGEGRIVRGNDGAARAEKPKHPLELEVLLAAGSLAVSRHKKAPAAGDRGKKCGMREL